VTFSLLASSTICILITLMLELLPPHIAGPLLVVTMVPWGVVGWTFPPAQASRIVAAAPELANLTLPLNMSAMYFGVAAGAFLGGLALEFVPAAELGLIAAAFPLAALALTFARRGVPVLAAEPGE
jgi:DHA1 family inner membrane transport protein